MYQPAACTCGASSGRMASNTRAPLSPARNCTCNTDLSGQIIRSMQNAYTRVRDRSAKRRLSALSNLLGPAIALLALATWDCKSALSAALASSGDCSSASRTASSRRRPADSQKHDGFTSTAGAASTCSRISCCFLLTSSRSRSASDFQASGAFGVLVLSVDCRLERYGLKPPPPGRPGAGRPARAACCASTCGAAPYGLSAAALAPRCSSSLTPSSLRRLNSSAASSLVGAQPAMRPRSCAQISHGLQPSLSVASVSKSPQTTRPRRARVSSTLRRRWSPTNPTRPSRLARTVETKMRSFSRPWKPSTLDTSGCFCTDLFWIPRWLRRSRAWAA
mmetsp:Transcript_85003/g.227984  ORF Transcript_85003/g.227984 Transcript_85003/m.227984 type:complete len:335 (+) Transcript_85003:260-1264(+)